MLQNGKSSFVPDIFLYIFIVFQLRVSRNRLFVKTGYLEVTFHTGGRGGWGGGGIYFTIFVYVEVKIGKLHIRHFARDGCRRS